MSKLVLTNPASFVNDASAAALTAANNAALTAAIENTLSRDGTSPNQMLAPLDMNSQRIINLPAPMSLLDPVRLGDLARGESANLFTQNGTGSVPRLITAKLGEIFSIADFGVDADASIPAQRALNAIAAAGRGALYLPAGDYTFNSQVNIANTSIEIYGDGEGVTRLLCNNTAGVFSLTYDQSINRNTAINIHDFDIVNVTGGSVDKAISVVGSHFPWVWLGSSQGFISRLRITSSTGNALVEKWESAIYLKNVHGVHLDDITVDQVSNATGKLIWLDNDNHDGANFGGTYLLYMNRLWLNGGQYGIKTNGAMEDVLASDCAVVSAEYGGDFDGTGGFSGKNTLLNVRGGHWNSRRTNIRATGWWLVHVIGADIYHGVGSGLDIDGPSLELTGITDLMTVVGNSISSTTGGASTPIMKVTGCVNGSITGNVITGLVGGNIGLKLDTCSKVAVTGNTLKDGSGANVYAYQVVNSTDVQIVSNLAVGWPTNINQSGNTNLTYSERPTGMVVGTDIVGAAVSTDNAIARYDGTNSKLQNSTATISDTGNFNTPSTYQIAGVDFAGKTGVFHQLNSPNGSFALFLGNAGNSSNADSFSFISKNALVTYAMIDANGLGIRSTGAAFDLQLSSSEALTANRKLLVNVGNAARTLTLGGNPTLNGGTHSGTNTGDQTITLTGNVTGSGTGSFATTIGANVVTNAMRATMAANTIKGNNTGGAANETDLTVPQAQAMIAPGLLYSTVNVNFANANTDTAIPIVLPAGFTRFQIFRFSISHATASLTTATYGIFSATAAGGVVIHAAGSAPTVSSAADATANNSQVTAPSVGTIISFVSASLTTPNTIYFRVGTAAAATADVTLAILPLP